MSKWLDEDDVKHVLASEAFLRVLEEYGDLKPSKDSWQMLCPFHDERNPSFSTNFGSGIYIYHCFGCLKSGTSITFLKEKENLKYVEAIERLARKINYPLRENGKTTASSNQRSRVPLPDKYYYTYQDAERQPLFRMGKQLTDTGKRFWSEVFVEPGQWRPGSIDQDKRPLFKLPAVLKAIASEETIYVVEGEKDVLAFEKKYGKVATTNPNGAGRWLEHHTETLVGAKKVVIIIDRDQVGLNHGLNIFADLKRHGINVFICSPVSSCNDISDHFNAGYGLKDLVPLAAKELMVSKKLNALDELHPEYSQKWSKIIEEAEFEEVEGVRLNANEVIPRDDEGLTESLRSLRTEMAAGRPAFVIFTNRTLADLVEKRPKNIDELLDVHGIGPVRAEQYGEELLSILSQFSELKAETPTLKKTEEAEFKEVKGVRLNAQEKVTEGSESFESSKGVLETIRGDLGRHYGIDFCLVQFGRYFVAETENASFLAENLGLRFRSNVRIPRVEFPVSSRHYLSKVLELVEKYEKSYAVVEESGGTDDGDIIRRVTYSSNHQAFLAVWGAAEFQVQSNLPTSLTAFELGRESGKKQVAKKQAEKKAYDDALASAYLIWDTSELPRHSASKFKRLSESKPWLMERYPRAGVTWSIEEDRFLIELHREGKNIEEISQQVERSPSSIGYRLRGLGF